MTEDKGVGLKGWLSGPKSRNRKADPRNEEFVRLDKHRIVVLPLANISPDPKDEYFADGLTEELISSISSLSKLSVISRTSAMTYKGTSKRVGDIGKELNVGSVLEGSVRKSGNKIRIAVQLVDSSDDRHLWAQIYEKEFDDVFAIQSDIARRVADALRVRILPEETRQMEKKPTTNSEAYGLYLKGRLFWNRRTPEWFKRAVEQFELVTKRDPGYALAYSGLADCYAMMGRRGDLPPNVAYPRAKRYVLKALALDENLAEPHATLGAIYAEFEWKWQEGETEFERSIELNPSYSTAHNWYGLFLGHLGRLEQAIDEANRAIELDPLSPAVYAGAAEEYRFAEKYDDAADAAEKAIEIDPSFGAGHSALGESLLGKGMYSRAITEFQKAIALSETKEEKGTLGFAYAISGKEKEALSTLEELIKAQKDRPDFAFEIGQVYLGLGKNEVALDWFETAFQGRNTSLLHLKCDPIFKSIRRESRLLLLLRAIGLQN